MPTNPTPTIAELRSILDYDPLEGALRWKRHRRSPLVGQVAGCVTATGYIQVAIRDVPYLAHRVAWAIHHGDWPLGFLDHINGNRADNRLTNLREATNGQNQQNRHGLSKHNTSGYPGVSRKPNGRWRAGIQIDGKSIHLGYFDSPEGAAAAYVTAKKTLHPFSVR